MPSRAELLRVFPNASEAFLAANAVEDAHAGTCESASRAHGPEPKRLDVTSTTMQLLMHGSEDDWQAFVIARAEELGWQWRHIKRTTIALKSGRQVGDAGAKDIPDLLLWRPPRVMWRELKKASERGKKGGGLTPGQWAFIEDMRACGDDADVWYPQDLERVLEELA